jgi:hypothetical protein
MSDAIVIHGYAIYGPGGAETGDHIQINQFAGGAEPWQAQIYNADGALEEAQYAATESEALRWVVRRKLAPVDKASLEPAVTDAASEHPVIKFSQAKEVIATRAGCGHHCGSANAGSCGCLTETQAIYRLFGIEVPDLTSLEDGEVLGLCQSGMLVQWNGDEQRCYVSDTLEEFGVNNLRDEELARLGLPPASEAGPAA